MDHGVSNSHPAANHEMVDANADVSNIGHRPTIGETQEDPLVLRVSASLLVGSASFVCAAFVIVCVRKSVRGLHGTSKFDRIHSCTMCMASGVFLATVFLALFPDLQHRVKALQASSSRPYPIAEVLLLAAFFINWTIDRFAAAAFLAGRDWIRSMRRSRLRRRLRRRRSRIAQPQEPPFLTECEAADDLNRDSEELATGEDAMELEVDLHKQLIPEDGDYVSQSFEQSGAKAVLTQVAGNTSTKTTSTNTAALAIEQERARSRASAVRFALLFGAMCAHAVLEGGALSVLNDSASIALLSIAMLAHTFICSCAVALAAFGSFSSRNPRRAAAYAMICSAIFCFIPFLVVLLAQLATVSVQMQTSDAVKNSTDPTDMHSGNHSNMDGSGHSNSPGLAAIGFESFAIGSFLYVVFVCWLPAELNGERGNSNASRSRPACHSLELGQQPRKTCSTEDETGIPVASIEPADAVEATNRTAQDSQIEQDQRNVIVDQNGNLQRNEPSARQRVDEERTSSKDSTGQLNSNKLTASDDAALRGIKEELLKLTLCFVGALLVALLRVLVPHH